MVLKIFEIFEMFDRRVFCFIGPPVKAWDSPEAKCMKNNEGFEGILPLFAFKGQIRAINVAPRTAIEVRISRWCLNGESFALHVSRNASISNFVLYYFRHINCAPSFQAHTQSSTFPCNLYAGLSRPLLPMQGYTIAPPQPLVPPLAQLRPPPHFGSPQHFAQSQSGLTWFFNASEFFPLSKPGFFWHYMGSMWREETEMSFSLEYAHRGKSLAEGWFPRKYKLPRTLYYIITYIIIRGYSWHYIIFCGLTFIHWIRKFGVTTVLLLLFLPVCSFSPSTSPLSSFSLWRLSRWKKISKMKKPGGNPRCF